MNSRRNIIVTAGFAVSVSLIASALAVMLVLVRDGRRQFELLNAVCSEVAEQEPEAGKSIAAALKEYTRTQQGGLDYEMTEEDFHKDMGGNKDRDINSNTDEERNINTGEGDILTALGYDVSDFTGPTYRQDVLFVVTGLLAGSLLFLLTFLYRNRKEAMRICALTDYLEQVPLGKAPVLSAAGEDDFSRLEDAIYKNVTYLYQTKDAAVQTKNKFAENLSNIAHQIKTPIAAMSLSVQMIRQEVEESSPERALEQESREGYSEPDVEQGTGKRCFLEQMDKQILRLTHLQEALLVLSRLDAGALALQRKETDVFTLLVLAADNLQELYRETGTSIDIPEFKETAITVDADWTIEAFMNLMKNCMEHNQGGTVHCSCEQNPLYTKILIWDEGEGFEKEDIPHLFERFYRGKNAKESGIGIGLSLSKELIELQNGTVRAKNMPGGGACFEIRFYRH